MGVYAINVGRLDLTEGPAFVRELAARTGLLWVSANVVDRRGAPLFPQSANLKWGDESVFVFGLTAKDPSRDADLGIVVEDPVAAARVVTASAPRDAIVICLTDLGYQAEHELLRQVGRINLVVGGGEGAKLLSNPVPIGSSLLLRCSDRGRELGVFDLMTEGEKGWKQPQNLARALEAKRQIEALKGPVGQSSAGSAEAMKTLDSLADEARSLALPPGPKYVNRIISLDSTVEDDPAVAKKVGAFQTRYPAQQQQQNQGMKNVQAEPGYSVGSSSCISCHDRAYRKWTATAHSKAMAKVPKEKWGDAKCHACHTTELVMQGRAGKEPTVGCEACHGRGSAHPGAGKVARKVDLSVCQKCHRGEHDGKPFDAEGGYSKIRCDR